MTEFADSFMMQVSADEEIEIDLRSALILSSPPTASTAARRGMEAFIVAGNVIVEKYLCIDASEGVYTWIREAGTSGGGYGDISISYDEATGNLNIAPSSGSSSAKIVYDPDTGNLTVGG